MPSNVFIYQLPRKDSLVEDDDLFIIEDPGTKCIAASSLRHYFYDYVVPSLSATEFVAASARIQVTDIQNYELSGFTVYGSLGINVKNPSVTMYLSATDAIVIPVGNNADRALIGNIPGALRYNSEIYAFEGNTGAEWVSLGETVNTVFTDLAVGALSAGQNILKGTSLEEFIKLLVEKVFNPFNEGTPYVTPSYTLPSNYYYNGTANAGQLEVGAHTVSVTCTYGNAQKGTIKGRRTGPNYPNHLNGAWDALAPATYPNEFITISSPNYDAIYDNPRVVDNAGTTPVYGGPAALDGYQFSSDGILWTTPGNAAGDTSDSFNFSNRVHSDGSNMYYTRVNTLQGPLPRNSRLVPAQAAFASLRWGGGIVSTNGSFSITARRKIFYRTSTVQTIPTFNNNEIRSWGGGTLVNTYTDQPASPLGGNQNTVSQPNGTGGFFFGPQSGSTFFISIPQGTRFVAIAVPPGISLRIINLASNLDVVGDFDQVASSGNINGAGGTSGVSYNVYYFDTPLPGGFNATTYRVEVI